LVTKNICGSQLTVQGAEGGFSSWKVRLAVELEQLTMVPMVHGVDVVMAVTLMPFPAMM